MNEQKTTIGKAELQQLAEMLYVFQQLPQMERTAIQYYIKGRVDAVSGNTEIPIKFSKEVNAAVGA